jgi:hypothetical protein
MRSRVLGNDEAPARFEQFKRVGRTVPFVSLSARTFLEFFCDGPIVRSESFQHPSKSARHMRGVGESSGMSRFCDSSSSHQFSASLLQSY